jgi:hypothetical protein
MINLFIENCIILKIKPGPTGNAFERAGDSKNPGVKA